MAKTRGKSEGSIYQRASDGKWCCAITLPNGKRRVLYGTSRKEVADKLRTAQTNVKQSLPVAGSRETLEHFLARWLKDIVPNRVQPSTFTRYELDVRLHITLALSRLKLAEVTPAAIQSFVNSLAATGLAPASVRNVRAVLRVALQQAVKEGLIGANNAKLVDTLRMVQRKVAALAPDAAQAILAAFQGHDYEGLVTLALATGTRSGELLGLHWQDVDLDAAEVRVHQQLQRPNRAYVIVRLKTEKGRRTLSLPPVALDASRRQRARQAEARLKAGPVWQEPLPGLVFTTAAGSPINGTTVEHRFPKQLVRAGLPLMHFHDLRHGTASLLLAQGESMRVVMEQLGHSQIGLTMNTYAHISPTLLKGAGEKLGRALTGNSDAAM